MENRRTAAFYFFGSNALDKTIYMGQEVRTGMDWTILEPYLPEKWLRALAGLPEPLQAQIQELRLRSGQPVTLSLPAGDGAAPAGAVSLLGG